MQTAASAWGSPALSESAACPLHRRRNSLCPIPQELPTGKVHRSNFPPEPQQTETNVLRPMQWLQLRCPCAAIRVHPSSEAEDIRRNLRRKYGRVYLRFELALRSRQLPPEKFLMSPV